MTDLLITMDDEPPAVQTTSVQLIPPAPPVLTTEEDSFALAYIEYSGNMVLAYEAVYGPSNARGVGYAMELLQKPHVVARIAQLQYVGHEQNLITLGAHLQELAVIRDLGKQTGQLRVSLMAEQARGEAGGLYNDKGRSSKGGGGVNVQINFASVHDANI